MCIFCKIANKEIASKVVLDEDDLFAFHDINAAAPTHVLIVPKRHISSMAQLTDDDAALMGRIMTLAPRLALRDAA